MRSRLPEGQSGTLSTLLRAEDWWSVWFGFILILAASFGLLTAVPKPGRWSVNPLDAFPDFTLLQLGGLVLGLGVLTAIGIRAMGHAASLLFSFLLVPTLGQEQVSEILKVTKGLRGWWFALAFVAIGLESNFRQLASQLVGGKPIWLCITGQSFNVLLAFLAAYLAFGGILFDRPL
ncbi:MAG: hypothetical protein IH787_00510 [Nitrospirae bacterium]|nr:hypothetical protein [Nitrospirota bacterium]